MISNKATERSKSCSTFSIEYTNCSTALQIILSSEMDVLATLTLLFKSLMNFSYLSLLFSILYILGNISLK